jgi:SpoVK/Ycf46/Vps4 family AAA+-type ATPase
VSFQADLTAGVAIYLREARSRQSGPPGAASACASLPTNGAPGCSLTRWLSPPDHVAGGHLTRVSPPPESEAPLPCQRRQRSCSNALLVAVLPARGLRFDGMPEGDLIKTFLPNAEGSERRRAPDVRRRSNASQPTAQRLRSLPRARGELDLVALRDPLITFEDLLLPETTRQLFAEVHLEHRREDFLVAHGVAPRRTFLFIGPPGCGKSATAEAVADELGRRFAVVNLSTVVSSFLGDTAKNLSAIFEAAAAEPWVILFDEFDAIGKERADRTDHGELKRVVTAFLQQLDGFVGPSILIAATNHPGLLDLAVWRRFDEVLEFPPPSVHEARALLRLKLRTIQREKGFDVELVARACKGLSHGDITHAVDSAYRSHLLTRPDAPLELAELLRAVERAQQARAVGFGA